MKGFTLIELVVSVVISLLLLSTLISNYNNYNQVQVLRQAALTLKNNFRFAQAKALSGEKPTTGCDQLVGWRVQFAVTSYSYQANCTNGLVGSVSTVPLPDQVRFSPVPTAVTFRVLSQGTSVDTPLDIILQGNTKAYVLRISPAGDISDLGVQ